MITAVALDMDGTLLDSNHEVSEDTVAILQNFQQREGLVILATGRTLREVRDVLPPSFRPDAMVGANGALIAVAEDGAMGEPTHHTIQPELISKLIDGAREHGVYYEIHPAEGQRFALASDRELIESQVQDLETTSVENHEAKSRREAVETKIAWLDELPQSGNVKAYFFAKEQQDMRAFISWLEELKETEDFSTSSSSSHNVEVMAHGINKATGVKELLRHFGHSVDGLLAVGDAGNDLPLLQLANVAAVMKNGNDDVKKQIGRVTEFTNDENGLAHFLKQHI
ncbi:Cof-type HAD-IIB family hydrolase [Paenalkalicoccus suaedae]|uniref:Cof-type HAD-IIB family hydrolase n=1 Tax=Paenalkalicoccus suaedae TaxID=2592382 RepID=A0A859FHW1_9BACI|nr:HAD family hydrolase [Paenalkalicoccus suaedae]QKS72671.1 Cof-type HAD-IIB family hydrolase [Paenalkalicoccus suaedae]